MEAKEEKSKKKIIGKSIGQFEITKKVPKNFM